MTDTIPQRRQILDAFLATQPRRPLIVILGPTASGKTGFSISLAKELAGMGRTAEVVNADSRQFYRGFDIGTAKITSEEKQGVDHHLIDVLAPQEDCTIAWYKGEAERVIAEIHARGHIPLLVGGSMLYVASLVDGLEPVAPGDPAIRARLDAEYDMDGGKTLFARLAVVDPETAASFPMQNKVYVVRAMEIFESTGKTKSSQQKKTPGVYDLLMFGMDVDKDTLHRKIAERTKLMLEHGWVDEVRGLKEKGVKLTDPAMKSVGYREIFEWLENPHPGSSRDEGLATPLPQGEGTGVRVQTEWKKLIDMIDSGTRAYAKRHMTWWKRDPRVLWIRPS